MDMHLPHVIYIGKLVKVIKGKYQGLCGRICSYAKTSCRLGAPVLGAFGERRYTGNIPFKNIESCQEVIPSASFVKTWEKEIVKDLMMHHEMMESRSYGHSGVLGKFGRGVWYHFFDNDDGTSNDDSTNAARCSFFDLDVYFKFDVLREEMRRYPHSQCRYTMYEWWNLYLKDVYYFDSLAKKIQSLFRMYLRRKSSAVKIQSCRRVYLSRRAVQERREYLFQPGGPGYLKAKNEFENNQDWS